MLRFALGAIVVVVLAGCGASGFALTGATVDGTYTCAVGSANTPYDLQVRIAADNPTSSAVAVNSVDAVMVVADIHGQWQQAVGAKYDAGDLQFSPRSVGANGKATLTATIHSSCTNGLHPGTNDNYADYSVQLTVKTSAGTFQVTSSNKHRIVAP
ncbi:MAG TPA: hypothetical protein VFL29_08870 [Candidatus Dormibacteraeota bacterium]|nr:hypothetical protein [Candidatus Dormibacteraeota bacterium]